MKPGSLARTAAAAFALLLPFVSRPAEAQALRGVVLDSASRQPIPGAVVMLLDSAGAVLARAISDERGQYRVAASGGARGARVVRIGFQPRELHLPPDRAAMFSVSMLPVSVMLAAVQVREKSQCPSRKDEAVALGLWEQARAGLLATVVARDANPASMDRLLFQRRYQGNSDRIARFSVQLSAADRADKAFDAAFPAGVFVRNGFAVDSSGVHVLYGPDAEVLLDDAFAGAYCFRVAAPARGRELQVGLAFKPARRVAGRVDIDGTLWVDTAARALSEIEYRYVGLPAATEPFEPGGRISFRQMANGVVLIDRWQLRSVEPGPDRSRPGGDVVSQLSLRGLSAVEFGGEIAHATWPDGMSWNTSLGSVRVHATAGDGRPAVGIVLALRDTHYEGTVDPAGNLTLTDLLPGPYWVEIVEPRIAELRVNLPTPAMFVAKRGATASIVVTAPTAEEFVKNRCRDAGQSAPEESMFIVGRVLTRDGQPVSDAEVTYAVKSGSTAWLPAPHHFVTGSDGVFQECTRTLAVGSTVRVRVHVAGYADADTAVAIASRLTVLPIRLHTSP